MTEEKKEFNKEVKDNKFTVNKSKKSFKIVLVTENYIVVDENGNGRKVEGKFKDKKSGDFIELDA